MSSYPTKAYRRTALAPGILGAIVLLAGLALLGTKNYLYIEFPVAILALIVCVFAWQAKQWWFIAPMGAIAVLWNPIAPFAWGHLTVWLVLQYVAAIVFIVVGVLIKIENPDDKNRKPQGQNRGRR